MGRVLVQEFITLDGLIGAPTFTLDYPFTEEQLAATAAITNAARAILLGRTTFVESGPAWSSRPDSEPGAAFFNTTPKHVVSGTLRETDWAHSSVLGGYDPEVIRNLVNGIGGGVYVYGSGTLVRAMLADRLVDELHLFVYPVTLGDGPALFGEGAPPMTLTLSGCQAYDNGVLHLTYLPNQPRP